MQFDLEAALEILERTPAVLRALLAGLSDEWAKRNEGGRSWSPHDVVGHLVHGEKTDWIARARIILERGEAQEFEPFDRFAQLEEETSLEERLEEFAALRAANLAELKRLDLSDLDRTGRHPELGVVTLRQLLATWVVHDLSHLGQAARTMARQYRDEVGPWEEYLPMLASRP
jgi:uncharacterized damage-inducible protein DinB